MSNVVGFTRDSARRIGAAVRWVEGSKGTGGFHWHPNRVTPSLAVIRGKTTAEWAINTRATVQVWKDDFSADTGTTMEAYNFFATIAAGSKIAIADGILISAECT